MTTNANARAAAIASAWDDDRIEMPASVSMPTAMTVKRIISVSVMTKEKPGWPA